MRQEQEIFDELAALCASPGYAHAIAMFCFRDNFVGFDEQLTAKDMAHFHSGSGLIRSEISTLIGLLVRQPVDYGMPTSEVMETYLGHTERLLQELHESLSRVWFKHLRPNELTLDGHDPFSQGEVLREPIFYGGDSAYSFQYRDLAPRKYREDRDWLITNKGFSIEAARDVGHALQRMQSQKLKSTLESLRSMSPERWTMLPAFSFTARELAERARMDFALIERILSAFTLAPGTLNDQFRSLSDFNVTSAYPLLRGDDQQLILFQHYSLVEALYETPFFWMFGDKHYRAEALEHRGCFTEGFSQECLERIFGRSNVYRNVDVFRKKGEKIGEIDVLVLFGNRAIVLQAKSKRLTLEARKGGLHPVPKTSS